MIYYARIRERIHQLNKSKYILSQFNRCLFWLLFFSPTQKQNTGKSNDFPPIPGFPYPNFRPSGAKISPEAGSPKKKDVIMAARAAQNWQLVSTLDVSQNPGKIIGFQVLTNHQLVSFPGISTKHQQLSYLLGGWTNPFEKYARQNGFIFPKDRDEN